jgi:hypothetical protein
VTTANSKIDAITSLVNVDIEGLPLGVNAVEMNDDGVPSISDPPRRSRLSYIVQGLPFFSAVNPIEDQTAAICQVWAEVGLLPYTVQSPTKRGAILAILQSSRTLPTARFLVQGGQKIILFSETRKEGHVTPEDIVWQTLTVLREARPFLSILAEYL